MKRETVWSKVSESSAGAVVVAQHGALLPCRNLCVEVDQVVRLDLALLLVKETVNLAASCSSHENTEQEKDTHAPIHRGRKSLPSASHTYVNLSYLNFHNFSSLNRYSTKLPYFVLSLAFYSFHQPLRCPSGCALGTSLGSWEISWASGMDYLPR